MSDQPPEYPPGDIRGTTPPDPVPFVIALAVVLVVAVLAFVFLREDAESCVGPTSSVACGNDR